MIRVFKRMKILFITPFGFDDRRRYFPEFVLARSLAKIGWSVTACVIAEGADVCRDFTDDISVIRLKGRFEAAQWLPKLIYQNDVIHVFHLRNPLGPLSLLVSKFFRRPVIFSEAGLLHDPYLVPKNGSELSVPAFEPESINGSLRSRFYHLPLTCADKVVFLSRHNMEIARQLGLDQSRIDWLPHVVDGLRFSEGEAGHTNATAQMDGSAYGLFVGQMKLSKGWDVLLRAIPHVPSKILSKFAFVSPSSERPPRVFAQLVESLGIQERVAYFGQISNPSLRALYQNCATVIVPSLYEGFGLATVEAFETSKPLIASNVVALNEVIQHGVNGYLVPPDDPSGLGRGIVEVMQNEPLRHSIVSGGKNTLAELAVDRWLANWKEIYLNAVGDHPHTVEQDIGT